MLPAAGVHRIAPGEDGGLQGGGAPPTVKVTGVDLMKLEALSTSTSVAVWDPFARGTLALIVLPG